MDQQKQPHILTQTTIQITGHPSHLWIGNESTLIKKTEEALQRVFCKDNGCGTCVTCKQIIDRQYSDLLWLCPEKNYTLDQLEPVFKTASFALDAQQVFFFVLQKADFFNQSCANALLKILEEPPTGYHFILLAERMEYMLPTIRSRCLIAQFQSIERQQEVHQIVSWFKQLNFPDAAIFGQKVDQANLSDRESLVFVDELFAYWTEQYSQNTDDEKKMKKIQKIITILKKALEQPPMPGSSKIFWKDLYLQIIFLSL